MKPLYLLIVLFALAMASCDTSSVVEEEELFESEVPSDEESIELSANEQELFDLVNEYRVSTGKNALVFSKEAYKYALEHNDHMISEGKLSHDNFSSRASKIAKETNATFVAENVAKDYHKADMALQGWMDSASHRKTIEGDFTHTAIGVTANTEGKLYYTQIFFRK